MPVASDTTGFMPVVLQLLPNKLRASWDTTGFTPVVRQLLPNNLRRERGYRGLDADAIETSIVGRY